jgi:hypothetical protein
MAKLMHTYELFVNFCIVLMICVACADPLLTVAVSGDEEEAKSLKQSLDDTAAPDESDSDQEAC